MTSKTTAAPTEPPQIQLHWGWIDTFIVVQYLLSALLFIPQMEKVRFAVKAAPYAMSALFWILFHRSVTRRDLPRGAALLFFSLLWLSFEMFHPLTQYRAGLAQLAFQITIAAPAFWAGRLINSIEKLRRAIILIFICNALSAGYGLLEVYSPEHFKPRVHNAVQQARHEERDRTYTAANGVKITRPYGLTDTPGGAGPAALVAALLGLALGARAKQKIWIRLIYAGASFAGMMVLYLTQMRALFLVCLFAMIALIYLGTRRRGVLSVSWVSITAASVVAVAFTYAVAIGGSSVYERFVGISNKGLLSSYDTNRGHFLQETFGDLMYEYPLGAGLGRWGMMNTYFNDENDRESYPIWVEIQFTGWLLDGGVVLWFLYGGATLVSMWSAYRIAVAPNNPRLSFLAAVVFAMNFATLAYSVSQLPFNSPFGICFWLLAAGLHGAERSCTRPAMRLVGFVPVRRQPVIDNQQVAH